MYPTWSGKELRQAFVATSHNFTVLSSLPDTIKEVLGLNYADLTQLECPM